jgi:hypothetical protein
MLSVYFLIIIFPDGAASHHSKQNLNIGPVAVWPLARSLARLVGLENPSPPASGAKKLFACPILSSH